jgi:hypothetical protein
MGFMMTPEQQARMGESDAALVNLGNEELHESSATVWPGPKIGHRTKEAWLASLLYHLSSEAKQPILLRRYEGGLTSFPRPWHLGVKPDELMAGII